MRLNKDKFTIAGRVAIGDENLVDVTTVYGSKMIKKDISIQDATAVIDLNIFETVKMNLSMVNVTNWQLFF